MAWKKKKVLWLYFLEILEMKLIKKTDLADKTEVVLKQ